MIKNVNSIQLHYFQKIVMSSTPVTIAMSQLNQSGDIAWQICVAIWRH